MTALSNRVIPCLLMQDRGLVKTRRFSRPKYVGDPINAIRIFNEKFVDELVLLDIAASRIGAEPDFEIIARVAGECFMPLCYGGGIRTIEQARRIISSGVEKLVINSAAIDRPQLISELSREFGASSIVAGIDFKRDFFGRQRVYHPGRRRLMKLDPSAHARALVAEGAGEIFLNSVDRDGEYSGYDTEMITKVSSAVDVPVVACGGAAAPSDLREALQSGASAAAAGSMFVFYGPHRAVLINYPDYALRELLQS